MPSEIIDHSLKAEVYSVEVLGPDTPSPVLERLHALVRKGYRPEIGKDTDTDVVVLRHLGKAPDLVLHSDGRVEPCGGRWARHKRHIEPPAPFGPVDLAEQLRFMRFLDTVPPVTFWHRNRPWRKKYLYLPAVLVIVWLACVMLTVLIFGG